MNVTNIFFHVVRQYICLQHLLKRILVFASLQISVIYDLLIWINQMSQSQTTTKSETTSYEAVWTSRAQYAPFELFDQDISNNLNCTMCTT